MQSKNKKTKWHREDRTKFYIKEEDHISYHGYKFYRDGIIINPAGQRQLIHVDVYGVPTIRMVYDDQKKRVNVSRIIYEMYSEEPLSFAYTVRYKDENPRNVAFDNLYIVRRKELLSEKSTVKGNEKIFTKEEADKIYEEYHKYPKSKNQFSKAHGQMSQRQLSIKYHCSIYTIEKIVAGEYYDKSNA